MAGGVDKEDKIFLNMFWLYKAGLVSKELFINGIDRIKHSFQDLDKQDEDIEKNKVTKKETKDLDFHSFQRNKGLGYREEQIGTLGNIRGKYS